MSVKKDKIRIAVTIPREINEQLKIKAEQEQRSVSNYVYNLIVKDLKQD
ncbi:ribbon-helix-helix domain-containing protein [Anaeromicrobium sediminis]|uniref:CopG-like ribbon-helix-helix domain-containing protein n=1 Tax=Anaeromicrobium sediminis TaxID=1478221 RepID=A0A267MMA6_9FIRM|nr:Arc family DNA-binding protein [Anaeromicrobium sediminis]PAB60542.1 hypothetical protein CCE28_03085 [Anaeromicrobium sediminis]